MSEDIKKEGENWKGWIIATSIAAFIGLSYLHNFIYTRTEAEDLKKTFFDTLEAQTSRMDRLDKRIDNNEKRMDDQFSNIDRKLTELLRRR